MEKKKVPLLVEKIKNRRCLTKNGKIVVVWKEKRLAVFCGGIKNSFYLRRATAVLFFFQEKGCFIFLSKQLPQDDIRFYVLAQKWLFIKSLPSKLHLYESRRREKLVKDR